MPPKRSTFSRPTDQPMSRSGKWLAKMVARWLLSVFVGISVVLAVDAGTKLSRAESEFLPAEDHAPANQQAHTLFQELDIQRAPRFTIAGAVIAQDLQYRIVSELRCGEPDNQGVRAIDQ